MNLKLPDDIQQLRADYAQMKYVFIAGGLIQIFGAVGGYIFSLSTAPVDSAFVGGFLATPLAMGAGLALQKHLAPESMEGKAYFVVLIAVASIALFLVGVTGIGDCRVCLSAPQ
jgi:hypothetical protein